MPTSIAECNGRQIYPLFEKTLQKRSFYKKQKIVELTADLHLRWQNEWQGVYTANTLKYGSGTLLQREQYMFCGSKSRARQRDGYILIANTFQPMTEGK